MVRSNNRLSAEVIEDILENNYNDTCFCSFSKHLAVFGEFLKLYDICTLSLVNRKGKITKDSLFYLFLKLVRMNLIFSNNEHIYTTVTSDISKIFSDGGMSYLFWMVLLEISPLLSPASAKSGAGDMEMLGIHPSVWIYCKRSQICIC